MGKAVSPIVRGTMFAVLAALSFGVTAPIIAVAGRTVGPLTTAALLYLGAALVVLVQRAAVPVRGARLPRALLPRVAVVALFGAAIAPTLLAWGLQRTGGTIGSLLLNLEAVFTVLLARAIHREPIGRRVTVVLLVMVVAGAALVMDARANSMWSLAGIAAVALAALAWSLDNALTRPLAEHEPATVVGLKGALGATMTGLAAMAMGEVSPVLWRAAILVACGASGYGLSLRLYLLAQRQIGVARTGSVFAVAPFVGAALGWALGVQAGGPLTALSAALFAGAVYLHITERHGHRHRHEAIDHTHAHRHDDGHHTHAHDPPLVGSFAGEHTHAHHHEPSEHTHEHAPDIHHGHAHDGSGSH